jgi:DNA-binding transcriptional ArsR family regulator
MKTNDEKVATHVLFMRTLGNEDRLSILRMIMNRPLAAQEVETLFFMEQSTASYHLNMMRRAGILDVKKVGKKAIYSYHSGSLDSQFNKFKDFLKH